MGAPRTERLRAAVPTPFALPALLPFPHHGSVLIKAADATARPRPSQLLQALMLRFLTAIPPGKVRFTIIDPVGLGENFAAFMHLADYDEQLVASRIWTEAAHIEQRLADLTTHMENVIQKYLRNEFADRSRSTTPRPARWPSRSACWWWPTSRPTSREAAAQRLISIVASGGPLRRVRADQRRHEAAAARRASSWPTWSRHCVDLRLGQGSGSSGSDARFRPAAR